MQTLTEGPAVIDYVNQILITAVEQGASDIHIEPYESQSRIRYRQDGLLRVVATPSLAMVPYLISRIKILAGLDIAERRLPQDGRFKLAMTANQTMDFRVSTCPTLHGEKLVIRVLKTAETLPLLCELGMTKQQEQDFLQALSVSQGLILVCGATGSGKTITLYTALQQLNTEEKNISSVEDPVEIPMAGINQVPVNAKAGLTFATALRSFLRQDPDVMMVGEIRDLETAEIAVKAAQTGHLVLSTLHTRSAPEALVRLTNMGIAPLNIANSLLLIVAQRLVRKLCLYCRQVAFYPRELLLKEGFLSDEIAALTLYRAQGCEQCFDGYKGRIGIFQVMPISPAMLQLIFKGGDAAAIAQRAQEEKIADIYQAGLEKVRAGITSLEELKRGIIS